MSDDSEDTNFRPLYAGKASVLCEVAGGFQTLQIAWASSHSVSMCVVFFCLCDLPKVYGVQQTDTALFRLECVPS